MPHDIFISYSRHDLAAVKPIKEELESLGCSCWMDLEGIESGSEEFTVHLASAIAESTVLLFFLSDSSQLSEWSLKEIRFAKRKQKRIVIVRFNNDPMTDSFDFNFGGSDIIDWRIAEQKEKLLRNLAEWGTILLVECPLCERKNIPKETFRCGECGRSNICLWHQNRETLLCPDCTNKSRREACTLRERLAAAVRSKPPSANRRLRILIDGHNFINMVPEFVERIGVDSPEAIRDACVEQLVAVQPLFGVCETEIYFDGAIRYEYNPERNVRVRYLDRDYKADQAILDQLEFYLTTGDYCVVVTEDSDFRYEVLRLGSRVIGPCDFLELLS